MGCGSTSAIKAKTKKEETSSSSNIPFHKTTDENILNSQHKEAYNQIISGVRSFVSTADMMPIVCFSANSISIAITSVQDTENEDTELFLPIVAVSMSKQSRIACLPQISMMLPQCYEAENTSRLFTNILFWVNEGASKVLLLNIPEKYSMEICTSLHSQNFYISVGDFSSDFDSFHILIVLNTLDVSDDQRKKKLQHFCSNGGGIICFHISQQSNHFGEEPKFNEFLEDFGLAYTPAVVNSSSTDLISMSPSENFNEINQYHFLSLIQKFQMMVKKDKIKISIFDDVVATLRYHILVISKNLYLSSLLTLFNSSISYLDKTHYNLNKEICPTIPQSIIALLISSISSKLPAEHLSSFGAHQIFPGLCNVPSQKYTLTLRLHQNCWISTGLWLQAGEIGTIEYEKQIPGVSFQIGCHDSSLLPKMGPWKRWPILSSSFLMKPNSTNVGNSFGGFLYFLVGEEFDETQYTEPLLFNFHNFCSHPRAVVDKPEILKKTKGFKVPWGELMTKTTIFSLPSRYLLKIPNIDDFSHYFDFWVEEVLAFLHYTPSLPFRVVFDIETLSGKMEPGYPIYVLMDDFDKIFNLNLQAHISSNPSVIGSSDIFFVDTPHSLDKLSSEVSDSQKSYKFTVNDGDVLMPSKELYTLLIMIVIESFPSGYFDETVERAMAMFAVTLVLKAKCPSFDLSAYQNLEYPPLFKELIFFHIQINSTIIPELLNEAQQPNVQLLESQEDMWLRFVKELCGRSKVNFSKVLNKINPIPLNIMESFNEFPTVQ